MSEIKPSLQLTYDQLLKVLRAWNEYLFIEFNEMPRNFEVMTNADYGGGFQELGDADAKEIKLSDLAEILWKTLEAGEQEVDRLHDEYFAERQVEHFKTTYQSVEAIAPALEDIPWCKISDGSVCQAG
jgi:hypothetical protein